MMKDKTTIKSLFLKKFGMYKITKPKLCKLENLNSPVVFSAGGISKKISKQLRCNREEHCDEFVFCEIGNATGIYCIENKEGKNIKLSKIREQLQGGAKIIESRLSKNEAFGFIPVLVTPRIPLTYFKILKGFHNESQKKLQEEFQEEEHKVKFITKKYYIRHVMDGDSLEPISLNSIITPTTK